MPSIAFIYEYGKEEWSTPWSLFKEFEGRGWKTSRYHLSKMNGLEMCDLFNSRPDIAIVMDWKGIDITRTLKESLQQAGTFLIREAGDTPQNYDRHLAVCNGYDLILTPDYVSVEKYKQAGYNCIWWTHFADTRIAYNYCTGFRDSFPSPSFLVRSTRGTGSSYILDSLSKIMPDRFINRNGLQGEEHSIFLGQGAITVQESRWKEITRRIFEGMLCNTMVLADRLPAHTHIDDLFTEGKDIVYYDGLADCISKINYYLSKEGSNELQQIAVEGRENVLRNHTQVQRVDEIIKQYELCQARN